jgi:hypothetical protein
MIRIHLVGRLKTIVRVAAAFFVVALVPVLSTAHAQRPAVAVQQVQRMPNTANPELLYWFINPKEVTDENYVRDLDQVAADGTFDFVFLTARNGVDFHDTAKMHPLLQDLVTRAHAKGIKVGLQLWAKSTGMAADQLQGMVTEKELTLDAEGRASCLSHMRGVRMSKPVEYMDEPGAAHPQTAAVRSELLRVYAFRKTGDGTYVPGSVVDLTAKSTSSSPDKASVSVQVDGGAALAGYSVYVMTLHYAAFPDLFSDFLPKVFRADFEAYKDIGFDGTALDEFRYLTIGRGTKEDFRERMYTPNMARYFREHTGRDLVRTLFDMRYAPANDPAPRIWAINHYFDTLRQGPLQVEQHFAADTTAIFGTHSFHGIHDTFHNSLDSDEVWQTGVNWWAIPRDYGQTDEHTPMTTRLGIGMAHTKLVEYNQFYTKDLRPFLAEGMDDARYNVRVHYHALNDAQGWGLDLRNPELRKGIASVEDKVRLLNQFDAPRPATNVLYVFGFPSLTNWFQPGGERNIWDINGALRAEEKAVQGWNAGYRGPLAASYLIDDGKITSDGHGGILYGGHRFTALVYFGPEYATEPALKLLEGFASTGGKLLLDGTAERDVDGRPIGLRFAKIAAKAVATKFDVDAMANLGVPKLAMEGGAVYDDGSVVLTDLDSLLSGMPKPFSVQMGGHTMSGSYVGLLALKTDAQGNVLKLAGGGLTQLQRDGKPIVQLTAPADLMLRRLENGGYTAMVTGQAEVTVR